MEVFPRKFLREFTKDLSKTILDKFCEDNFWKFPELLIYSPGDLLQEFEEQLSEDFLKEFPDKILNPYQDI